MDKALGREIGELWQRIVANFTSGDREEVGLISGQSDIWGHYRLLRRLDWGDPDYSGNVLSVLREVAENAFGAFAS